MSLEAWGDEGDVCSNCGGVPCTCSPPFRHAWDNEGLEDDEEVWCRVCREAPCLCGEDDDGQDVAMPPLS